MKEITINLDDQIAENVSNAAKRIGLTSEELIKYHIGTVYPVRSIYPGFGILMGSPFPTSIYSDITTHAGMDYIKHNLRMQAQIGELKCNNCTMSLTPEDVDNNKCHTCQAPIITESAPPGESKR
jgi:hypothetical protein